MGKINDYNERIDIGLTSISIGDYQLFKQNEYPRLGCLRVVDNETRLRGLISEDGEEILPCIFDDVDVKLDGIIEVHFKGRYYEFIIMADGFVPERSRTSFFFSKKCFYELDMCNDADETTQQLITFLNVKHSINQDQYR